MQRISNLYSTSMPMCLYIGGNWRKVLQSELNIWLNQWNTNQQSDFQTQRISNLDSTSMPMCLCISGIWRKVLQSEHNIWLNQWNTNQQSDFQTQRILNLVFYFNAYVPVYWWKFEKSASKWTQYLIDPMKCKSTIRFSDTTNIFTSS